MKKKIQATVSWKCQSMQGFGNKLASSAPKIISRIEARNRDSICSGSTLLPGPVVLVIATSVCLRSMAPHHGQEGNGGKASVELWAPLYSLGLWCGPDTAAWTSCASSGVSLSVEGNTASVGDISSPC